MATHCKSHFAGIRTIAVSESACIRQTLVTGMFACEGQGRITNSYPKSMDPYRIIPLITESYPYTKFHPNMGYDSVICHCLGYDLMRILNDSFLI